MLRGWQWSIVGVLVAACLALGGVAGYRYWDQHRDKRDYPESVRDNFLVACASSGGSDGQCGCALEYVEDHATLSEFTGLERAVYSGEIPGLVLDARRSCGMTVTDQEPVATLDHTEEYPDPGGWSTLTAKACPYELLEVPGLGGGVIKSGTETQVVVPRQVGAFRFSSSCPFTWDGGD